ncbi:SDR family NAD(P)-dependent oxidoreductase [Streptomyces sp. SYSU K217416]
MRDDQVAGPSGRTVLVTGGTSGIGAAVARRFAADGEDVIVAGLGAERTAAELPENVRSVELDVTRPGDLHALVDDIGKLHVLVNAAGVIARGREYDVDVFADVVGVNLTGTMRSCVAARKVLASAGGCIVNVASMLSFFGGPKVPAYSSSKGGVMQLTKSLAIAWAEQGIRVNAVAPGWIHTGLTQELHEDQDSSRRIIVRTPMRRWGTPADVAGAVSFLAGPDASFITGAVLTVDGGYLAA